MKKWFLNYWGVVVLTIPLLLISLNTVKPGVFVAGWDNFSTSLDLNLNIKRTLFSTWRSYRGFGVESDSEAVDIFHQIFLKTLSLFTPIELTEQIYIISCLWLGVIGIYFLIKTISQKQNFSAETAALIGGLFYLLNLNTIGSFFYPMIMYVTRYGLFPWIIASFIRFSQKPTAKSLLFLIIINLAASSAYLTATVFVTLLLILILITITNLKKWKRNIFSLTIIMLINSYWLLPFSHYTYTKSPILPLATTFADVNENQLNESPTHFEWNKLLTLYPSFLYIDSAKNVSSNQPTSLHPQAMMLDPNQKTNWVLYIFSALSIVSCIILLFKIKNPQTRWIPLLFLIGIAMVRKEYPPFGWLYDWLGTHIPYFKIIFRFGDAKFNALIAIAGSVGIGLAIQSLPKRIIRPLVSGAFLILIFISLVHFRFIFTNGLISEGMYVTIPDSYQKIAQIINADSQQERVLHLPFDTKSYWKSYSWGYFGSSFMSFMLNKPLFERTFAPASLENDFFDTKLSSLIQNYSHITNLSHKRILATESRQLFANAGIKYIVWDDSVSTIVLPKNIIYWGNFRENDTKALIDQLESDGHISRISSTPPLSLYALNPDTLPITPQYAINRTISLYQVFISKSENDLLVTLKPQAYPFTNILNDLVVQLPLANLPALIHDNLNLYASDWHTLNGTDIAQLRLKINNLVLPLPYQLTSEPMYLATINTSSPDLTVEILAPNSNQSLPLDTFSYNAEPNCLGDKFDGYHNTFNASKTSLSIVTTNGSTCVVRALPETANSAGYSELTLHYVASIIENQKNIPPKTDSVLQQSIYQTITALPSANYFTACILDPNQQYCLNNHHTLKLNPDHTITIPVPNISKLSLLLLSIPTLGHQTVSYDLSNLTQKNYISISQKVIPAAQFPENRITPASKPDIPKSLSNESFYFNPNTDSLRVFNQPCTDPNAVRENKSIIGATLLYNHNCFSGGYYITPYSKDKPHYWQIEYNLLSGKFPHLTVNGTYHYFDQYASLGQGYPNIAGFKRLQVADPPGDITQFVSRALDTLSFQTTSVLVPPQPDTNDITNRTYTIQQDTPNTGLVAIHDFSITELPREWDTPTTFTNITNTETMVLPSLWKITTPANQAQIQFSQGYDPDWQLFQGIRRVDAEHVKINNLTNGWNLKEAPSLSTTYYAFYTPEILSIAGWVITFTSIMWICFNFRIKR